MGCVCTRARLVGVCLYEYMCVRVRACVCVYARAQSESVTKRKGFSLQYLHFRAYSEQRPYVLQYQANDGISPQSPFRPRK